MVDLFTCPVCGGPPRYAVALGPNYQCQCRNCGISYSTPTHNDYGWPVIEDDQKENNVD